MKLMHRFLLQFVAIAALLFTSLVTVIPTAANAGISFSTTARTNMMGGIVTTAGATGAKLKLYNGCSIPSGVSAATGCTLLATLTWTSVPIGTATGGTIDWDEAGVSQSNGSHVSGTPLFAHITTSADVIVARVDICGSAPCWTFTGSVATGQNVTLTGLVFTAGNS